MKLFLIITGICLAISLIGDRKRTWRGLKSGIQMFLRILPTILTVIIAVSILIYVVHEQKLALWFGDESGVLGYISAALVGSVSLIQGFIAYPMAGILVQAGVGYPVIAIFITTLMMVGIITLPVEARYLGWRIALARNSLAFVFALSVGLLMGLVWEMF